MQVGQPVKGERMFFRSDLHIFQNLAEKKFYLQGITDACVKKAVLEICFEKNTKELVAGPYKNICTIAVHC